LKISQEKQFRGKRLPLFADREIVDGTWNAFKDEDDLTSDSDDDDFRFQRVTFRLAGIMGLLRAFVACQFLG
jgi:hypothetical protein